MRQPVLERGGAPSDEPADRAAVPTSPALPAWAAMPEGVRAAFERLASCDGWSDAAWAVRSAVLADRRVDDRPEAWVEEELQVLEAVEQVKAWADVQGLAALRRLREAVGERVRYLDEDLEAACGRGMPAQVLRAESDIATVDEVVLALGLPAGTVSRRLDLAVDRGRPRSVAAPGARGGSRVAGPSRTRPPGHPWPRGGGGPRDL